MMSHHKFFLLVLLIFELLTPLRIYGEEDVYIVYDARTSFEQTFASGEEAFSFFTENRENYENLVIKANDQIIEMEYGIIEFNEDEEGIAYYSLSKDEDDLTYAAYGIDAAYLATEGDEVTFMLANDLGRVSADKVILHPFEDVDRRLSIYRIANDEITHLIRTQLAYDYCSYALTYDKAPEGLSVGDYYSYDGHYFYDDFYLMIDDYRKGEHENARNEEACFSYFVYLPYRSLSNYHTADLESYFYDTLHFDGRLEHYHDYNFDGANDEVNRSQLYGNVAAFVMMQDLYGTNALMLAGTAINESAYGKDLSAYKQNKLYDASAYTEEEMSGFNRYASIEDAIYSQARYIISSLYGNYRRSCYRGTFFGNKTSGLNVNYTPDPYYGEKSAASCYQLDKALGQKDLNDLSLAVMLDRSVLNFYRDAQREKRLFTLRDITELSMVIIAEDEEAYLVQIDSGYGEGYRYDFTESVAYIGKEDVDIVINKDRIHAYELENIHYELGEGNYHGYDELDIRIPSGEELKFEPAGEGLVFTGFTDDHEARYKEAAQIQLSGSFSDVTEAGQPLSLDGGILRVTWEDGTYEDLPLNTDMISGYDEDDEEETLLISYAGHYLEKRICFSNDLAQIRADMAQAISDNDPDEIKKHLKDLVYPFTFNQLRDIDQQLRGKNQRNYVIKDETGRYDLSVSGLDLALNDRFVLKLVGDTYYVNVNAIAADDQKAICDVAEAYGFTAEEGIDLSFAFNYQKAELNAPIIVQLDPENKTNDRIYTVYHRQDDGDIVKCRTSQSENYVQFSVYETGAYLLLSKPSVNEFKVPDGLENLNYTNVGFDNHRMNFELMSIIVLALSGIIGIIVYYIFYNKREKLWKDFRRSLREAGFVPAEKLKN